MARYALLIQATVRQLITHTARLAYWFWNSDIDHYEQVTGVPNVLTGSEAVFTSPLAADPGTRFEYGINVDWLGRVVEAVSTRRELRRGTSTRVMPLGDELAEALLASRQVLSSGSCGHPRT